MKKAKVENGQGVQYNRRVMLEIPNLSYQYMGHVICYIILAVHNSLKLDLPISQSTNVVARNLA